MSFIFNDFQAKALYNLSKMLSYSEYEQKVHYSINNIQLWFDNQIWISVQKTNVSGYFKMFLIGVDYIRSMLAGRDSSKDKVYFKKLEVKTNE